MRPIFLILSVPTGILLLIACLILFGTLKIRLIFDGDIRVVASAFGIRYTILSPEKKQKKEHPKLRACPHSDRALRKEWKKQKRRAKKLAAKEAEKAARAQKKALEKQKKKQRKQAEKASAAGAPPAPNLKENLEMVFSLLKKFGQVTQYRFRIRIRKLQLWIATDNAADTAILYGITVQALTAILQWIHLHAIPIRRDIGGTAVRPDYLCDTCHAEIDITCSLHLRDALAIGIRMLFAFLKERKIARQKALDRVRDRTDRQPNSGITENVQDQS